jgi:hypothetical protein
MPGEPAPIINGSFIPLNSLETPFYKHYQRFKFKREGREFPEP